MEKVHIYTKGNDLNFDSALDKAKAETGSRLDDPMLLSWFEKKSGRFSPYVTCC